MLNRSLKSLLWNELGGCKNEAKLDALNTGLDSRGGWSGLRSKLRASKA